jgi:general secretion pathway protein N
MRSRAILNLRRAILVGLMTFSGLVGAASQQTPDPVVVPLATDSNLPTAALPDDGAKQRSMGPGNPLWSIPLASLTATRERPIFSPTRRPPPAVAKPTSVQPFGGAQLPLALVGAIAGDVEGIAIFLDGITQGIIRLKTGESHAGWTLQAVKAREVILEKEQKTTVLALPNPPAK